MLTFSRVVRSLNQAMGMIAAPLIGVVTIIVLYEVIVRYFFHAPTSWAQEMCEYLLCALVMFGTGYTLSHYGHTRVDILYSHMSERAQARVEILVGVMLIVGMLPIIWLGGRVAIEAFMVGDTSSSAAALPLGPAKATVPLGAVFLLLQGLANAVDNLHFLITGRKPAQS